MRVLFVYPNLYTQMGFNHGLASLSAVLCRAGHETRLVNLNENLPPVPTLEDLERLVRDWRPGLIAFSCLTMQYQAAVELAWSLRERFGADLPPLAVGGIHPTMVPDEVMAEGVWDAVGVGECEDALLEFVTRLDRGERPESVPNFVLWAGGERPPDLTRADAGAIDAHLWRRNPVGEFPDLTALPIPDYALFDTARITAQKHGWFGLMTSRGCPYRCTYCLNHKVVDRYRSDLGRTTAGIGFFRYRPPELMVEEIRRVLADYPGVQTFILDDDLFTMNPEHAIAFCDAYAAAGFEVPFVVNSHVKRLDPRVAAALARAGCRILKLGIESGSPRVRAEVLKRFMAQEDIAATAEAAEEHRLHTSAFVMIGLPSETRAERLETVELLARTRVGRFRTSFFYPFPGTEGFELAVRGGHYDAEQAGGGVSTFTDGSVLRFGESEDLFIDKLGVTMPWFVNARLDAWHDAPAARRYRPLVERVLDMDASEWRAFRPTVRELDQELSARCLRANELHYAIRYNAFMGVRSDWFVAEESGIEWATAAAAPGGGDAAQRALAAAAAEIC